MFGRRSTRINDLLRERDELMVAVDEAETADLAASARADLHAVQHSLWLAGYEPEEVA